VRGRRLACVRGAVAEVPVVGQGVRAARRRASPGTTGPSRPGPMTALRRAGHGARRAARYS
jgi:hypothetical protein